MRRRRRRRQWWGAAVLLLVCGTVAYGWYARNVLAGPTPASGGTGVAATGLATEWQPEPESTIFLGPDETESADPGTESSVEVESASIDEPSTESDVGAESETPDPIDDTPDAPRASPTRRPTRTAVSRPKDPTPRDVPVGPSDPGTSTDLPPSDVETVVCEKDGSTMVRVSGGRLAMGTLKGEPAEAPVHSVSVPTFWIDRTEVTNEQYRKFIEDTGRPVPYVAEVWAGPYNWDRASRTYPKGAGDMPVVLVSWDDALAFARWAGKRLPTEAEWEYAARGADGSTYPWGDTWSAALCNSLASNPTDDGPAAVGSSPDGASWCGAVDMAGNVWEWCADWFSAEYYAASPDRGPAGPATGRYRSIRGGSWGSPKDLCKSYARGFRPPYARSDAAGFRCAADSPPSEDA